MCRWLRNPRAPAHLQAIQLADPAYVVAELSESAG